MPHFSEAHLEFESQIHSQKQTQKLGIHEGLHEVYVVTPIFLILVVVCGFFVCGYLIRCIRNYCCHIGSSGSGAGSGFDSDTLDFSGLIYGEEHVRRTTTVVTQSQTSKLQSVKEDGDTDFNDRMNSNRKSFESDRRRPRTSSHGSEMSVLSKNSSNNSSHYFPESPNYPRSKDIDEDDDEDEHQEIQELLKRNKNRNHYHSYSQQQQQSGPTTGQIAAEKLLATAQVIRSPTSRLPFYGISSDVKRTERLYLKALYRDHQFHRHVKEKMEGQGSGKTDVNGISKATIMSQQLLSDNGQITVSSTEVSNTNTTKSSSISGSSIGPVPVRDYDRDASRIGGSVGGNINRQTGNTRVITGTISNRESAAKAEAPTESDKFITELDQCDSNGIDDNLNDPNRSIDDIIDSEASLLLNGHNNDDDVNLNHNENGLNQSILTDYSGPSSLTAFGPPQTPSENNYRTRRNFNFGNRNSNVQNIDSDLRSIEVRR